MILYLIKSTVCLGLLLLVYLLFLEREKMHRFNRWYLMCCILFSLTVPLISFSVTAETLPVLQNSYFEPLVLSDASSAPTVSDAVIDHPAKKDLLVPVLLSLYAAVCLALLFRFIRNIFLLLRSVAKNKIIQYQGAKLVLMNETVASYSFLGYIFINEEDYLSQSIQDNIIQHELTHVKEKHSWDVIFIELLQTIFWFNPLFLFYKKAIQLNHEYLADEGVVKHCDDIPAYQYLLLDKAMLKNRTPLSSAFNYSVTKKRLIMMTKKYNQQSVFFKKLCMIPLCTAVILIFSTRQMIAQEKNPPKTTAAPDKKRNEQIDRMVIAWGLPVTSTTGVPDESIKEFNGIIDRAITIDPTISTTSKGKPTRLKSGTFTGTGADRERLLAIYKGMNAAQRKDSKIYFSKRYEVPKKTVPTEAQFEKWKDPSNYGVWIDDKKVSNEELNKYKASDFSYYSASNLAYTQQMKDDVMKRFNLKTMYKVQLNLSTNDGYDKWVAHTAAEPAHNLFYLVRNDATHNWSIMIY